MRFQTRMFGSAGVLLIAATVFSPAAASSDSIWHTEYEQAAAAAEARNADMLILFTGSDWCSWCMKLDEEVLGTPTFRTEGPKRFVLLKLDFPRKTQVPEDVRQRREALSAKYKARGFPTVVLTDSSGSTYARTGYRDGGAAAYIQHLDDLQSKKGTDARLLEQAERATGAEKAKLLHQWLKVRDTLGLEADHKSIYSQIVELDADGSAGLKKEYENKLFMFDLNEKLNALSKQRKVDEIIALIDSSLDERPDLPATDRQRLLYAKASTLLYTRQFDKAEAAINAGEALGGPHAATFQNLRRYLDMMKKQQGK